MASPSRPRSAFLSTLAAICSLGASVAEATPVPRTVFAEEIGWIS